MHDTLGASLRSGSLIVRRLGQWLTLAMHLGAAAVFLSIRVVPSSWSAAAIDFLLFQFFLFEFVGALACMAAGKAWYVTRPGAWLRTAVIVGFAGFMLGTLWSLGLGAHESAVMLALIGTIGGRVVDWSFRLRAPREDGKSILLSGAAALLLWLVIATLAMNAPDATSVAADESIRPWLVTMIALYYLVLGVILFVLQGRYRWTGVDRQVIH